MLPTSYTTCHRHSRSDSHLGCFGSSPSTSSRCQPGSCVHLSFNPSRLSPSLGLPFVNPLEPDSAIEFLQLQQTYGYYLRNTLHLELPRMKLLHAGSLSMNQVMSLPASASASFITASGIAIARGVNMLSAATGKTSVLPSGRGPALW